MIYLDNSATTPLAPEVIEAMAASFALFANPSSTHACGRGAKKLLEASRAVIAAAMSVREDEVVFTSGGTESDNVAVFGVANKKRGRRVVTTQVEHPAVSRAMDALEENGFEIIRVAPNREGNVVLADICKAINSDTSLVSVMHVNNETGAIMPIERLKAEMTKLAPRALLHTDAVQSFGHVPFTPAKWGVDIASISSHKIHGPKGIGALYVAKGCVVHSPVYGGAQERGIRSGTENTLAAAGFAAAVKLIDLEDSKRVLEMKKRLCEGIMRIGGVHKNGGENSSPYILNLSIEGVPGEVMLNALDARGICVSSGSACAAAAKAASGTLKAMNAPYPKEAVRFSLSRYNTLEEIKETINAVVQTAAMYRRK
ncbi:MAG: cysteine desulfurase family protein [Clostridia bacterium]|nr:cysteine desulfurase family protein [Clostridia bacterium]